MFERYIASLDSTLQGFRPCLAMVNRTLERMDERLVFGGTAQAACRRGAQHTAQSRLYTEDSLHARNYNKIPGAPTPSRVGHGQGGP